MMAKVAEERLQAIDRFGLGKDAELDQFTDETHGFDFRFDVDLILSAYMSAKFIFQ